MGGKIYFYSMTAVFITGTILAGFRYNQFLFLVAFLSYYSVFAGVRILSLKDLHKDQKPKRIDWIAGSINAIVNLIFIGFGVYLGFSKGFLSGGALMSIGFGGGGILISYTNLQPFIVRPTKPYHWYQSHIGNMMGGYIATLTAFLSTLVTRFELMNPYLAFVLPSLIGVPMILFSLRRIEKQFMNLK